MFQILLSLFILFYSNYLFANPNVNGHISSPITYAVRTGIDTNGAILYLCQAKLFNSIQPGKTWFGYDRCNVAYGGKEYVIEEYTIPSQRELGHLNWTRDVRGALQIGRDTNGNPLFVCQANFHGSIQPGKTWQGYNHCNFSFAGREIITDNYRVLSTHQEIIVGSHKAINIQPNQLHSYY